MSEISVIIPCYNSNDVLHRCLESLLSQTFPVDIIIVNDGSTDGTLAMAEDYAARFGNISVVSKENGGLPQARKTGLEHVKTPYVGFIDSDDWVEPNMYGKLYESITEHSADIAICGLFKTYEGGGDKPERQKYPDGTELTSEQALEAVLNRKDVFMYMWNKLYRTEIFDGVDFPQGNFTGEDFGTLIQILEKPLRISVVNAPLCHYWQSISSMSRGGFKESHQLAYQNYQKACARLVELHPDMENDIIGYLSVEYMALIIAMSRNGKYDETMKREIVQFIRQSLIKIMRSGTSFFYKVCAVSCAVNTHILTGIYSILR